MISLDSFKGQVVVLNFWATWCVPCRIEMPAFFRCCIPDLIFDTYLPTHLPLALAVVLALPRFFLLPGTDFPDRAGSLEGS
ncbi:MAG: TlpA family protein disulfide reductase [Nitrospinae bacterium]|nr:TlpA family protein disulfide reductase [Nitrospinota bacterium]